MRLLMLAFGATAVAAVALTACGGGGSTAPSYLATPPPAAGPGTFSLSSSGSQQQLPAVAGVTGVISWTGGSGVVDASTSTTNPTGTIPVNPAALRRAKAAATNPSVVYVTITAQTAATLEGLPGIGLTYPSAITGTYQEAEYANGTWTNVESAPETGGDAVSFTTGKTPITLAANGSIYLAIYEGTYPEPTPTPTPTPQATPTNVLADPSFESGTQVAYTWPNATPSPNATGWTQCSVFAAESGVTPIHPISSYTPNPGTTPAAVIMANGSSVPQGSSSPVPTQTTVPVASGTYAAVFGALFSNYNAGNYGYNGLCQTVTVPVGATMTMDYFANGNEGATYLDFDVLLLDTSGNYLATLLDTTDITSSSPGDNAYKTQQIPATAFAPYVGQKVELFIGMWTKAGSGSGSTKYSGYFFIDDAQLMGVPQ
ncbi:MAG TPA: hypothetical protein VMD91_01100 [Candidatus Sulfotelmatobacter sp.]|nr:hypothetical protein [Candidatus Sulfotelmatobacter sp.]